MTTGTVGTGFAANLFVNGNEKVLAIRGSEQPKQDIIQADLLEIGLISAKLGGGSPGRAQSQIVNS